MVLSMLTLLVSLNAAPAVGAVMPCTTAMPTLMRGLDHVDAQVREFAADLLGDLDCATDTASTLASHLNDANETWSVRAASARALGHMAHRGNSVALRALADSLKCEGLDARIHAEIVRALWTADDQDVHLQPGTLVQFDGKSGTHVEALVGGLAPATRAATASQPLPAEGLPRFETSVSVRATPIGS